MPALTSARRRLAATAAALAVLAAAGSTSACHKKVDRARCDELVGHFAELVVRERFADASAETVRAERARELGEARREDAFRNCPSEVQETEFACAMRATTSDALLACLE